LEAVDEIIEMYHRGILDDGPRLAGGTNFAASLSRALAQTECHIRALIKAAWDAISGTDQGGGRPKHGECGVGEWQA